MKKVFITTIPLQGKMERTTYFPEFYLKKNRETSFPIIPLINSEYEEGDNVIVIAIYLGNKDSSQNYNLFVEELRSIGIEENEEISIPENSNELVGLTMLRQLLSRIPDDSLVYADITFGTKPIAALVLYAMNNVEKLMNVEVKGVYYGEIPRENNAPILERATLHDLTAYKRLSDILNDKLISRKRKTQVFISYRRDGGDALAYLMYESLTKDGYSVFLDVQALGSGKYGDILISKIEECTDFLLILSKDSLDRCNDPEDWVRREIECALHNKKNIIPLMMENFENFSKNLPESMGKLAEVAEYNGVKVNFSDFKGILSRLESNFLNSKKIKSSRVDF